MPHTTPDLIIKRMRKMNKTMIYGMLTALFALASCMGNGNPVSLSDLEGEWNVVELAGQSVNTKQQPFIGFDTREMRVYGYGGCNRLMGSFEWSDESAQMVMDKLASTMMACPDMEQEKALSHALSLTKKVKRGDTDQILLCDSLNQPLAKLNRRCFMMPLSDLQGIWDVVKVNGEVLPDSMENRPFFSLDITEKTLSGNAGCNQMNGKFKTLEKPSNSLVFLPISSTRMTCPNIETEFEVLAALKEVTTFGMLPNGHVGLFAAGSVQVLELAKRKN